MKITVKIFKSNVWNCLPFFMSFILVTAALFLFEGIEAMFFYKMSAEEALRSNLGVSTRLYIYVLLFIGVILILYTVNNYSRKRIRDYGTFLVLGSEKRSIIRMVITEYGMISIISYIIGCVFGTVSLFFVRGVILSEKIRMDINARMYFGVVLKTLLYMLALYAAAVFMNVAYLQGNSLSSLMHQDRKKSSMPSVKACIAGTPCAAVCFVTAYLILGNEEIVPYIKMKYGLIFVLAGLFLCFTYIGGFLLYLLKKREKWYYKYLLRIKNMYYRFADNKNIMLLSFVINIVVLVFVNMNIVEYGDTDSRYLWKYPFDYVYIIEENRAEGFLQEIKTKEGTEDAYPCIFLTSTEYEEFIGMPVSAFNRLAGKDEELRPGEVIGILQKRESDEGALLPLGRVCLETGKETKWFNAKIQMNQILFAAHQPESIGVLALNDSDYDSAKEIQKSMSLITQTVKSYDKETEKRLKNTAESYDAALFYSKEELMLQDRKEDILSLVFYICMGIFLIISNMSVLAIKVWSEIPALSGKYGFLNKLGMDGNDIKCNVKKEISACMKVPFVLSFVTGILILAGIFGKAEYILDIKIVLLFAVLAAAHGCFIAGMTSYGYHLIRNRLNEGNGVMVWSC